MRILLTSTQYPGNGGASTNIYELYKYLSKEYSNIYCLFFLSSQENIELININPDKLKNVSHIRSYWRTGELMDFDKKYKKYSDEYIKKFKQNIIDKIGGLPDIILAKNYRAPITSNILFPNCKICYLVSGVLYLSLINKYEKEKTIQAREFLNNYNNYINKYNLLPHKNIKQEIKTLKIVDHVIFNSELTYKLMDKFYNKNIKKYSIVNTSLLKDINNTCSDFKEREYDIIFICSKFDRKIKNSNFVKTLFLDKRLSNYKKITIGKGDLFNDKNIENLINIQQQPHKKILYYMRKSKLLIIPSLFDSSPNIMYEGLSCGCNILISKNIGNYKLLNSKSICEDVSDKNEWIEKIIINLEKHIPNKLKKCNINDIIYK